MKTNKKSFKIKKKLIVSYLIISLIPIFTLGYYLTNNISNNSLNQTKEFYNASALQLKQNLVNKLNGYVTIVENIIYNKNLISYLNMQSEDDVQLYNFYRDNIEPVIGNAMYNDNSMLIRIYTDNQRLKFSSLFIRDPSALNQQLERISMSNYRNKINWNGVVHKNGREYLSCSVPIFDYLDRYSFTGVLELMIELKSVNSLINAETKDGSVIFIHDGSGNPIVSSIEIPEEYRNQISESGFKNQKDDSVININKIQYLFIKNSINNEKLNIKDWTIGYLIPLEDINRSTGNIWMTSICLSLICLLLSILILLILSNNITSRIGMLIRKMSQAKEGDLKISVSIDGNDEIAELGRHFNDMILELDLLMNEVYKAKLEIKNAEIKEQKSENARKEAQLLALQSQINPHYLFNTMESIRMNLLLKGDSETSEVVKLFADSFRVLVYEKDDMVCIKEELEFIKKYFLVQKYRYEDRIRLLTNIDGELMPLKIPKFILQPLVENAIYHGLELKDGEGKVAVNIFKEGDFLHINVTDDGVGMAEEKLKELMDAVKDEGVRTSNYALRNIRKRLKLLFENRAALVIQSEADAGTSVDISIPMEELI